MVKPAKSTCAKLLKSCTGLSDSERNDLAAVLQYWTKTEDHAKRVAESLSPHPTAIEIRNAAMRIRPQSSPVRPRQGCPYCFGSGFAITITRSGYTGAQQCSCVATDAERQGHSPKIKVDSPPIST